MSKITRSAISQKPIDQKKKKKIRVLENIFLHLYTGFGFKKQNTNGRKSLSNFLDICKIDTLWPTKWPSGDILKIQNRLRRAP